VTRIIDTPQSLKEFIGREIGVSEWSALTQERIDRFAEIIEDRQWIHVDRERAQRDSPFGTTIAHGFLTLSLLSRSMREALRFRQGVPMSINYGFNRVRFPCPVRANSRIRARFSLQRFTELADAVEAVFDVRVETEDSEKPCCIAEWIVRYYSL
jgi:acyl dehydratase